MREAAKEEAAPVSEETQEAEIESRSSQMEITASVNASEKSVQITASGVEARFQKYSFLSGASRTDRMISFGMPE